MVVFHPTCYMTKDAHGTWSGSGWFRENRLVKIWEPISSADHHLTSLTILFLEAIFYVKIPYISICLMCHSRFPMLICLSESPQNQPILEESSFPGSMIYVSQGDSQVRITNSNCPWFSLKFHDFSMTPCFAHDFSHGTHLTVMSCPMFWDSEFGTSTSKPVIRRSCCRKAAGDKGGNVLPAGTEMPKSWLGQCICQYWIFRCQFNIFGLHGRLM
jgi:hypothetical protein